MKSKLKVFFQKKENLYLALALSFGLFMVFFNPPFAGVPDESAHFLRATSIANGNIICKSGDTLDVASANLAEELKPVKISGNNNEKISLGKIKKALFEKDDRNQVPFNGVICGANPLGYFPQVIGISIANVFDLPVLWGFYMGRLLNMLTAVLIGFFAIKLLPFGKIVFLLVALLPMTMQQFASFSYDSMHISAMFLLVSYLLNLASKKEKISQKEMLLLAFSAILAANVKWGFFPIMLLLFVLPTNKFGSWKQYWTYILMTMIASFGAFFVSQAGSVSSESIINGVYPAEQLISVLKNPFAFLNSVFLTLYDRASFFFESFLYKPGWLNVSLSPLLYVFMLLGMIVLIRSEDEEVWLNKKQRTVLGMTFLASLLFVFLSLYVFWSKVGGEKIQGVQGRYFLGFFPLLIMAFYKSKFDFRFSFIRKNTTVAVFSFVGVVFLFAAISLWNIYYDQSVTTGKYIYEQYISKEEKNKAKTEETSKFRQTFLVKNDDFLGVKLFINKNTYTGKGTFYLKDAECQNILRKKELTWNNEEFGSIEIKFGLIPGVKKKQLCLEGELLTDQALAVKVSEDIYGEGALKINDIAMNKDLIFDLMYKK